MPELPLVPDVPEPVAPPPGLILREESEGEVVLPDMPFGPQSFIALFELSLVPLVELELLDGVLEAELPGPQSVAWPMVLELVPGLAVLAPPVVLLVCAMAAVPSVRAKMDAAVTIRRFIRLSSVSRSRSNDR